MAINSFDELALGQHTDYPDQYSPGLLTAIPRALAREALAIDSATLPFVGEDVWTAYELSWLNPQGRPEVATAEFRLSCDSPSIVESKSFKLYLNSLNQSVFESIEVLASTLQQDLSACAGSPFSVQLLPRGEWAGQEFTSLPGECLDDLDIVTDCYLPDAGLLQIQSSKVFDKSYYSHLFRSLCPVTAQPDWASVWVSYRGAEIAPDSLLKYLVSYRKHQGFHEQCVEKIFVELMQACAPEVLTVGARFTRRGGLDINPVRSTEAQAYCAPRLFRQ